MRKCLQAVCLLIRMKRVPSVYVGADLLELSLSSLAKILRCNHSFCLVEFSDSLIPPFSCASHCHLLCYSQHWAWPTMHCKQGVVVSARA